MPANPEPPKVEGDTVQFAWAAEPGQRFEFQMARDKGFSETVTQKNLAEPAVTLPRRRRPASR